jgi:hypothetical protein
MQNIDSIDQDFVDACKSSTNDHYRALRRLESSVQKTAVPAAFDEGKVSIAEFVNWQISLLPAPDPQPNLDGSDIVRKIDGRIAKADNLARAKVPALTAVAVVAVALAGWVSYEKWMVPHPYTLISDAAVYDVTKSVDGRPPAVLTARVGQFVHVDDIKDGWAYFKDPSGRGPLAVSASALRPSTAEESEESEK